MSGMLLAESIDRLTGGMLALRHVIRGAALLAFGTLAEVSVDQCVHPAGYRFGPGSCNPYQRYLERLVRDESAVTARREFVHFLAHYWPTDLSEALGLPGLKRSYPLWQLPWQRPARTPGGPPAAMPRADACPDILTHYSPEGILSFRIDEEFVWMERALRALRQEGYRPERYGYPIGQPLVGADGTTRYLLKDGNHRVAALAAMGQKTVRLRLFPLVVRADAGRQWPAVRSGQYDLEDALAVFNVYLEGNRTTRTTEATAAFIAPRGWKEIYL